MFMQQAPIATNIVDAVQAQQIPDVFNGGTTCPVCEKEIAVNVIEEHANACLERTTQHPNGATDASETPPESAPFASLQEEIALKSRNFIQGKEPIKFVIRQNHLTEDVLKKLQLFFKNDPLVPITVEFIGEEAIDEGGPLPELFTSFYDGIAQLLMYGQEKRHNCIGVFECSVCRGWLFQFA